MLCKGNVGMQILASILSEADNLSLMHSGRNGVDNLVKFSVVYSGIAAVRSSRFHCRINDKR